MSRNSDWSGAVKWVAIAIGAFVIINGVTQLLSGGTSLWDSLFGGGGGSSTGGGGTFPFIPSIPRIPNAGSSPFPAGAFAGAREQIMSLASWIPVFAPIEGVALGYAAAGVPGAVVGGAVGQATQYVAGVLEPDPLSPKALAPFFSVGNMPSYGIVYAVKGLRYLAEQPAAGQPKRPLTVTQGGWARNPDGTPYTSPPAYSGRLVKPHPYYPVKWV